MTALEAFEREAANELATRYERDGFLVERDVVYPEVGVVDLVASRGGQTVLIEVRTSDRESDKPPLARIAEFAANRGWSLNIAIANPGRTREVTVPTAEQVRAQILEAQAVRSSPHAFGLVSWAALESAARLALTRMGVPVPELPPTAVVNELAFRGLVSLAEERTLDGILQARNHLAHGQWQKAGEVDFSPALTIAERLLLPGV